MQYRSGKELRELFLSFFEEKGCKRFKSFSLIPEDPSLLFTIAGMVPFKPYFLGIKTPPVTRATTAQKCIRTNDIENVGRTSRHHTFFEMLGNFSFGDYFKKEIIPWSWEFLTERVGINPERLYVTVYKDDDEAYNIWKEDMGLNEDRITRLGDEDNFWAAGPTGPCGPCSEIIYDQGPEFACDDPSCAVGCDCDRYLEIWNLVFMQYDRDDSGNLTPLPNKNIDTGMGLERLASIVQGAHTDFETDLFIYIIEKTCELSLIKYGDNPKKDMYVRIISDHIRASAFMIADGVLPSNEGTGYVLRRLIRRCVRYGKLLGIEKPFLSKLLPSIIETFGEAYIELEENSPTIVQILNTEEERFLRTLVQGNELLESEIKKITKNDPNILSGKIAFTLYDTFGFPIELTTEICDEHQIKVNLEEFENEMQKQRERARASNKQKSNVYEHSVYDQLEEEIKNNKFVGYENFESKGVLLAIIKNGSLQETVSCGEAAELILSQTPFYAEKGGQVGDTGLILGDHFVFEVNKTNSPAPNTIVHKGIVKEGSISVNAEVVARIDVERRESIKKHHTATHLLNEALNRVLGDHVRQAGSLVTSTFLRFDFNHFSPLSSEDVYNIEETVYSQIIKALHVRTSVMSFEEAKNIGAKALFNEKYEKEVRVLDIEDFSLEFCGGTHVKNTGEIGFFKIIKEEGIGSGVRRITAMVGMPAFGYIQRNMNTFNVLLSTLNEEPKTVLEKINSILDDKKELERKNKELQVKISTQSIEGNIKPYAINEEVSLILEKINETNPNILRQIGDSIRNSYPKSLIVLLGTDTDEKNVIVVSMATESAIKEGIHSGKFLKELASFMGGKGGGKPNYAQGGVKNPQNFDRLFDKAHSIFLNLMKGTEVIE